jgi:hypothetical protein
LHDLRAAGRTAVIGVAAAGALAGWWALLAARAQDPAGNAPPAPAAAGPRPALVGQSGCSAGACHGNPSAPSLTRGPDANCWKSSFTHWLAADPHTRAYRVLLDDDGLAGEQHGLAKRIVAALAGKDAGGKPKPHKPASEDARCLACHTNPAVADDGTPKEWVHMRAVGVSCEACHGPADKWLARHITWKTPEDRTGSAGVVASGMANLNDVGERAKMCAGCHVGAPADPARGYLVPRDMNHDMIAAGHPRLNFDFAAYQRRLPPHWQEKDRTVGSGVPRGPDFEAKMWLVGRVATAEAACEFTADRAARAQHPADPAPWPELSESNCFACHHNIIPEDKDVLAGGGPRSDPPKKVPFWRQTPAFFAGRSPGCAPWQTLWPASPDWDVGGATADLGAFREEMQKLRPNPGTAATKAAAAAASLKAARDTLAKQPDAQAVALVQGAAKAAAGRADRLNWDEAGELYQALVTLEVVRQSRPGAAPFVETSPVGKTFGALRKALMLPSAPRTDSPKEYRPDGVGAAFRTLVEELGK